MGRRMSQPPKIFHANWFRTDEEGNFLWPGYGENLRVIEWILARSRGEAEARETPIGFVPTPESIDLTGLDLPKPTLRRLFAVQRDDWKAELNQVSNFFEQFGNRFPRELWEQHEALSLRLEAPTSFLKPGSQVRPLAVELNQIIREENPHIYSMLSQLGKRLYFPKGILSQSTEAKERAFRFDATIGIAREGGQPMFLPSVMKYLPGLSPAEAVAYAPATGLYDLRKKWGEELLAKNPSLAGRSFGMPIVTGGVTHALSIAGDLFVDKGDVVLLPDKFWENYELLFGARLQAQIVLYPFFNEAGGFNTDGLRQVLETRAGGGKTILILNFPNNPTGYSITQAEAEAATAILGEAAEGGCNLVVVSDDAYFGLFHDEDVLKESLFARLAGCHERMLVVKVDGPTKEGYAWGFRIGMLTFSACAASSEQALYDALEKKVAGAIRSSVSNCSHPAQSMLLKAMSEEAFSYECQEKSATLAARAKKVKEILTDPGFADLWETYPFNAGYFMCLRLKGIDAERFRKHLLEKHGLGVIAEGKHDIRIAFSAVDLEELPSLYAALAAAAREIKAEQG